MTRVHTLADLPGDDIPSFTFSCRLAAGICSIKIPTAKKIFIKPKQISLTAQEFEQIVKTIYGLADVGEYCHDTLANHLREHLRFSQATTDLAL